jgi:DNA topoisomerase-2
MEYYGKRKAHLAEKITSEWDKLDNRVKFVTAVIAGELVVANRKKQDLVADLRKRGFKALPMCAEKKMSTQDADADENENENENGGGAARGGAGGDEYDYLLSMKLWSLTAERVQELTRTREAKRAELDALLATTAASLWLADLDRLELALDEFDAAADEETKQDTAARVKGTDGSKKRGRASAATTTTGQKKAKQ